MFEKAQKFKNLVDEYKTIFPGKQGKLLELLKMFFPIFWATEHW